MMAPISRPLPKILALLAGVSVACGRVAAADAAGSRASTLSNGGPAGRYASLSDLPRLDVVSMRVTGGRCADASAATRETGRHAGAVDPVRSRRPDYGHFRRP